MLAHPIDKDQQAEKMAPMRALFQRGLVLARDLPAGYELTADDLLAKKPAKGLPAAELPTLVGRRLRADLGRDHRISWEDVE